MELRAQGGGQNLPQLKTLIAVVAGAGTLAAPAAASAATFTVDTNSGVPTTGACSDSLANDCSIHDAVAASNASGGPDQILFDFDFSAPEDILLGSAIPEIEGEVAITGPGSDQLEIDGDDTFQILLVAAVTGDLTLSGVTLDNGFLVTDVYGSTGGGAIRIGGLGSAKLDDVAVTRSSAANGGAILVSALGALEVSDSRFANNEVDYQYGLGGAISASSQTEVTVESSSFEANSVDEGSGGAISAAGDLTIRDSSFTGNSGGVYTSGSAVRGQGDNTVISGSTFSGAPADSGVVISIFGNGSIENSTISGNAADSPAVRAVSSDSAEEVTIDSTTISGNAGVELEQALDIQVSVENSIIADVGDSDPDLVGTFTARDSLIFDPGLALINGGSSTITGEDPLLGPLADNGGPTLTMAIPPASPALNAGDTDLTVDQRGVARPKGADDIGSYEADLIGPATTIDSGPSGTIEEDSPTFGFSSTDPDLTGFECRLLGPGAPIPAFEACASPLELGPLGDGDYEFEVRATDIAGNEGQAASRAFTVETPEDPGPGPDPDTEVTDFDVTAKKGQKQKGKQIKLKVSAGAQEGISVKATGKVKTSKPKKSYKLKPVTKAVDGGKRKVLKLKPAGKADAKKIKKAIKKYKQAPKKKRKKLAVKAPIKVVGTDASGNKAVEKRVVTLK